MKQPSPHPERAGAAARPPDRVALHVGILILLGCAVMLPRLGQQSLLDGAEVREAEIAREMADSGDYVVPRLLGTPAAGVMRFGVSAPGAEPPTHIVPAPIAPPLFRWVVAALFRVTGRANLLMARLPSALMAVAAAVAICLLGRCWFRPQAGLWAGVLWLTFPLVVEWGRLARPDMAMSVLVLCGILFATWAADKQQPREAMAFWCCACLFACAAMMTGGLKALFFFAAPTAVVWRVHRKRWLPPPGYWAFAAALFLATAAGWILLAELKQPGNLRTLAAARLAEALSVDWHILLPVEQLLFWTLPWVVFAAGAGYAAVRRVQFRGFDRLGIPAAWMLIGLVALTLAPVKEARLLLPLAPFWALFLGAFLDEVVKAASAFGGPARRWLLDWPLRVALVLMAVAAGLFPILWSNHSENDLIVASIASALAGGIAAYGAAVAFQGRGAAAVKAMACAIILAAVASGPVEAQTGASEHPAILAASEFRRQIPQRSVVAGYRLNEPLLFFRLDRRTEFPQDEAALSELLAKPGPHYVITPSAETGTIKRLAPSATACPGQWAFSATGADVAVLEVIPSGS